MVIWIYDKDGKQRPAQVERKIKRGKNKGKCLTTIHRGGTKKKIIIGKPLKSEV